MMSSGCGGGCCRRRALEGEEWHCSLCVVLVVFACARKRREERLLLLKPQCTFQMFCTCQIVSIFNRKSPDIPRNMLSYRYFLAGINKLAVSKR